MSDGGDWGAHGRCSTKDAINDLRSMGMRTAMLTGDSQAAANHAQDQLGDAYDEIQAGFLPEQKAAIIQGYKNKVGLCGCGFCYVVDAELSGTSCYK